MGPLTDEHPKCLTRLHGKTLLQWQLEALTITGIKEIAIVKGYQAALLNVDNIHTFKNTRWKETNMVVSLQSANQWLQEDTCIVSYADIIYHHDIVAQLKQAKGDIIITYDTAWLDSWKTRFDAPLEDAETFTVDSSGCLSGIGAKATDITMIEGQYMGLLKFTPEGWAIIDQYLQEQDQNVIDRMDMTSLLSNLLLNGRSIHTVPIAGRWYEIDSSRDLELYQGHIANKTSWLT